MRHLLDYASAWWPTLHRELPADFPQSLDAIYPGIGAIASLIFRGLFVCGILALAAAFLSAELRVKWLRLLLFLAVAATAVTDWGTPADFLKQFLASGILLTAVVVGIRRIVRFNLLGLFLIVVCTGILSVAAELITEPNAFYRANAYACLIAVVVLLAWPLLLWRVRAQQVPPLA